MPKISDLTSQATPTTADSIPIVSSGTTKKTTLGALLDAMLGFLPSGSGAAARTVQAKLRDTPNAYDFGAVGDGTTNDTTALTNHQTANNAIVLPAGTFLVTGGTTFSKPVVFMHGAKIKCTSGVITFGKGIKEAPLAQIFELSGGATVAFTASAHQVGYPEWWGAATGGTDCTSAISACFVACAVTQLQGADYHLGSTPVFNTPHRTLQGASSSLFQTAGQGTTRLLISSTTADGIQVGPTAQPATINDFTASMTFRDFQVGRSAAPTISSGCRGILNQFTLYARFENIRSVESMYGWEFKGTSVTYCDDCYGFRSTVGQGAGTDYFRGMYINGNASIGASGGNASLYINRANVSVGGITITDSIGYYGDDDFSDVFMTQPEASGCSTPIYFVGNNLSTSNVGNINLRIINPVLDAFDLNGLHLKNIGKYGVVQVQGGYAAASSDATVVSGIRVESCAGAIDISGMEVIGGTNTNCAGIYASSSSNLRTRGNIYTECARGPIYLDTVTDSVFLDTIKMNTRTASNGVLLLQNCLRNKVDCLMTGAAGGLGVGVGLNGDTNTYNEINATNIDAACITGGVANKVVINSVQITNIGQSGTNVISGINNTTFTFSYDTASFTTATITTVNGTTVNGSTALTAGGLGSASYLLNLRSNSNRFAGLMQYAAADGNAPQLRFAKNRGTVASPTALSSGDNALEITATTWDGTADRNMGSIFITAAAAHASGDTPGEIQFWTTPASSTTRTKRFTVDKDGALISASGTTTVVDSTGLIGLRTYTVATLPSAATAARVIYVSDESGGAVMAFSDGTNWRRVTDRAVVS